MRRGVPAAPETRTVDGFRGRLVRLSDRPVLRERAQLSNKQNVRLVRKPRGSVVGAWEGELSVCAKYAKRSPNGLFQAVYLRARAESTRYLSCQAGRFKNRGPRH